MNVCIFSKDARLFLENSPGENTIQRHLKYALRLSVLRGEKSTITILTLTNPGFKKKNFGNLTLIPTNTAIRIFFIFSLFFTYYRYVKENKKHPDLITFQTPWEEGLVGLIISKIWDIPICGQLHMRLFSSYWIKEGPVNFIKILLGKFVLRRCHRIRVVSQLLKDDLINNGISTEDKIDIVPVVSQFDSSKLEEGYKEILLSQIINPIFQKGPIILYVGRFSAEKDVHLWLRTAQIIQSKISNAQFVLVGSGPLQDKLIEYATQLGIKNCCHFIGEWPQHLLPMIFDVGKILLLTSAHEGFCRVINESYLQNLPVVATNEADPDGIIKNEKTGYVVEKRNENLLAEFCVNLISNDLLQKEMGNLGRSIVEKRYNPEIVLNNLVGHWEKSTTSAN